MKKSNKKPLKDQ